VQRGWTKTFLALSAVWAAAPAHAQSTGDAELRGTLGDDGRAQSLDLSSESAPLIAVFVDGATIYNAQELATLYADRLGREADLTALVALAEDITARYREDGYFLSRAVIPEAALHDGVGAIAESW